MASNTAIEQLRRRNLQCRQAFILHRARGMSYSDIANEMGVSVSSVEKCIIQALKRCRQEMLRYYTDALTRERQTCAVGPALRA